MEEQMNEQTGAIVATNGFADQSIQTTGSTVEALMAARAKALVEARFIVAMQRPRNIDVVRTKLLKAVERPGFADADIERNGKKKQPGSAWYKLPYGDGAEGFSIRFAEECMRVMGNLDIECQVIWEDDKKRLVQVTVTDLETNIAIPKQITIEKTMIRLSAKKGQHVIGRRINSQGKETVIIEADELEMAKKQNAAESKAIRNAILRLVPGDIQAECRRRILEIRHGETAKDPDGARKRMIDAFARINVSPVDLEEYTGIELGKLSPPQIDHLRELHGAIKIGETTWKAVIDAERAERNQEDSQPAPVTMQSVTQANKEKAMKKPVESMEEPPGKVTEKVLIDLAVKAWGDDSMLKLPAMMRDIGTTISGATVDQLLEAFDRLSAIIAESGK